MTPPLTSSAPDSGCKQGCTNLCNNSGNAFIQYRSVSWVSVTVSRSNGERLRHDVRNFITSENVGKYLKTSKECRIQYEMNDINRADEFQSKRMRTTRHEGKKETVSFSLFSAARKTEDEVGCAAGSC